MAAFLKFELSSCQTGRNGWDVYYSATDSSSTEHSHIQITDEALNEILKTGAVEDSLAVVRYVARVHHQVTRLPMNIADVERFSNENQ